MKKHNITKIPVLEDKKIIGVITDNVITLKLGAIRNRGVPASRLHASSVMEKEIETVSPDEDLSTIIATVGEPGPTMLHVIENDTLVGVVTKADLLPLVDDTQSVEEIMQKNLHYVSPEDRVIHARRKMIDENIARLPVINNGMLIGMVSDIDIAFAIAEIKRSFPLGRQKHQLDELLVNDVMRTPAISINYDKTVTDAAKLMMENHVGSLPVIKNGKVVGIITRTDLLKTITL